MATMVQCDHCGATYETEASAAAVEEVARCQECGVTALVVLEEEPASASEDLDQMSS